MDLIHALKLVEYIKSSEILDIFHGLYSVRKKNGDDPFDCPRVVKAQQVFIQEDYQKFIELAKKAVEEYGDRIQQ